MIEMNTLQIENDRLTVKVQKTEESARMLSGQLNYVKK
jgi:hypothetical protein